MVKPVCDEQLSLLAPAPTPPAILPSPVGDILHAARSVSFSIRIVRGCWGIGIGTKRRWVLTGTCCCAVSAFLVAKNAIAFPHEISPMATAARMLGLHDGEVGEFVQGFDDLPGPKTDWRAYGQVVARELGVTT